MIPRRVSFTKYELKVVAFYGGTLDSVVVGWRDTFCDKVCHFKVMFNSKLLILE